MRTLAVSLLVCLLVSQSFAELRFESRAAAFKGARELQAVSQSEPSFGNNPIGFNLLNGANSGLQKNLQINNQFVNFTFMFETATDKTFVINTGAQLNSYTTMPNNQWNPQNYTCNGECQSTVTNKFIGGNITGYNVSEDFYVQGVQAFIAGDNNSATTGTVTLPGWNFTVATQVGNYLPQSLYNGDADGVFGVGLNNGACAFLDALQNAGLITSRNFSLFTTYDPFGIDYLSQMIVGGYNPTYLNQSDFNYVPLSNNDSWSVTLQSASVNSTTISSTPSNAVISSLLRDIVVPSNVYSMIPEYLNSAGGNCLQSQADNHIYCQCVNGDYYSIPNLNLQIGGITYEIPSIYMAQYDPTQQFSSLSQVRLLEMTAPKFDKKEYSEEIMSFDSYDSDTSASDEIDHFNKGKLELYSGEDSWSTDDDWSDDTNGWTYDYSYAWNYPYFYYDPWFYGYSYYYPYYTTGPIIIYDYNYYNTTGNYSGSSNSQPGDVCAMHIGNANNFHSTNGFNNLTDFILGLPFTEAFYIMFDAENQQVGISTSNQPIHFWRGNEHVHSKSSHWWIWLIVGIGAVIILAGIIYWCSQKSNRGFKKEKKHHKKGRKNRRGKDEEEVVIVQQIPSSNNISLQGYNPPNNFGGYQQPQQFNTGFNTGYNQGGYNQGYNQFGGNGYQQYPQY